VVLGTAHIPIPGTNGYFTPSGVRWTLGSFALQTVAKSLAPPGFVPAFEGVTRTNVLEALSFPVGEDKNDYSVFVGATGIFVASMVEGGGGGASRRVVAILGQSFRRVLPGLVKGIGRGLRNIFVTDSAVVGQEVFWELAYSWNLEGSGWLIGEVKGLAATKSGRTQLLRVLEYSQTLKHTNPNVVKYQKTLELIIRSTLQ
jgi:hypothetical protein